MTRNNWQKILQKSIKTDLTTNISGIEQKLQYQFHSLKSIHFIPVYISDKKMHFFIRVLLTPPNLQVKYIKKLIKRECVQALFFQRTSDSSEGLDGQMAGTGCSSELG